VSSIERTEAAPVDLRAAQPGTRTADRARVRRPADAVALVAATILLVFLARRAGTVSAPDESLIRLIRTIPTGLRGVFVDIYRLDRCGLWRSWPGWRCGAGGRRWPSPSV
jgi:hypothetical protein